MLPLVLVGLLAPLPVVPRIVLMALGLSWLVGGRVLVPRLRPRACTVTTEPGSIIIGAAGLARQRLAARDVRAAAIAPSGTGFALGIVRGADGDRPLWLELASREDLDRVRGALGIGRAGFGAIQWPPQRGMFHTTARPIDAVAALGWLAFVGATVWSTAELALLAGIVVVPVTLVAMILAAVRGYPPGRVRLTPAGLRTLAGDVDRLTPWAAITAVRVEDRDVVVDATEGRFTIGMRDALPVERARLAGQIDAAAARARDGAADPAEVPASVAVLVPRDEPTRTWLERVDATAATFGRGSDYRRAGLVENDLWSTLESPDAPVTLRAAAARVLARVDPGRTGPRIALALGREPDDAARGVIVGALEEDVDTAAREMEQTRGRGR
jgi:hypothetical protein